MGEGCRAVVITGTRSCKNIGCQILVFWGSEMLVYHKLDDSV